MITALYSLLLSKPTSDEGNTNCPPYRLPLTREALARLSAPSDEGAVEPCETEGEKNSNFLSYLSCLSCLSHLSLPPSGFA